MYDIVTIGSATQDIFLVSKQFKLIPSKLFATGIGECVSFGSKIEVDEMLLTSGGGGTNAAATCGSFGLKTAVVARIGDDAPGAFIQKDLERFHVDTSLLHILSEEQTGLSTLLTASNGERSVLVHRGASGTFSKQDIPEGAFETAWIYLTSLGGKILVTQHVFQKAKVHGIKIFWNPGSTEIRKDSRMLKTLLEQVDVLSVNLEELKLLTKNTEEKPHIRKLCEQIHHPGMCILVTDGGKGSYAYTGKEFLFARTRDIPVISRTGAGDAFGSGFVAALIKGIPVKNALRIATLNAESVIGSLGAKNGILTGIPNEKLQSQIHIIAK